MEKSRYKEIRGRGDFLYTYFVECGGTAIPPKVFYTAISIWCMDILGFKNVVELVNILDKKYNYIKIIH